jgi:hypothetical protein
MVYLIPLLYIISFFTNGEDKKKNQFVNTLLAIIPMLGFLIILGSGAMDSTPVQGVYTTDFGLVVFTVFTCVIATMILAIIKFVWFLKKIYS